MWLKACDTLVVACESNEEKELNGKKKVGKAYKYYLNRENFVGDVTM